MSVVDFNLPTWGATVWHSTPGSDGVWNRAFNAVNEESAIEQVKKLFAEDGLNEIRIDRIEVFPLIPMREEDENGD